MNQMYLNEGDLLFEASNYSKAYEYYNKASKSKSKSKIVCFKKGRCLRALYKYKEAIELFNEAIKQDESYISAYNFKGLCLVSLNSECLSMDDFTKAYELNVNPIKPKDLLDKAITLYCLENYMEALNYYDKYLKMKQSNPYSN
jgi:tetratricopeptide (TPR) repeat protein